MDVGGTHVTAAKVNLQKRALVDSPSFREPLNGDGSAEEILSVLIRCAARLSTEPGGRLSIAVPGPFDYALGTARYAGVGKFDALYGVDLRAALRPHLPDAVSVSFHNDAEAFLVGEWWAGAASGHGRAVGITLGTGVGSCFLRDGRTLHDEAGLPPEGRVDLLRYAGRPLEETVSRRAIRRAYLRAAGGGPECDVRQIAERARRGDRVAADVFTHAFRALGAVLRPCLAAFEPTVIVLGGSIAASWDLVAGPFQDGLAETGASVRASCTLKPAHHPAEAPLLGAAYLAMESGAAS